MLDLYFVILVSIKRIISGAHQMKELFSCQTHKQQLVLTCLAFMASALLALVCDAVRFSIFGSMHVGVWYNKYFMLFTGACFFTASLFFIFRHRLKDKPERLFLAIVLIFTISSSLIYDINKVCWDAESHFRFTLSWSELDREVEVDQAELDGILGYSARIELDTAELANWKNVLNSTDDIATDNIVRASLSNLYKYIATIPSSLVYACCSLLNLSFSLKYVLSKLIYAVIYSFVVYLGMKQLKSGKMIFASIAMLPTALFLAANYGYDYWVNGFMLLGVATLVGVLQREEALSIKSTILMLGAFALACGPKAIYFPLVLLCLLIPKRKFSKPIYSTIFRAITIAVSVLIALSFLIPQASSGFGTGDLRGGATVNASEQVRFILHDPLNYIFGVLLPFLWSYLGFMTTYGYMDFFAYLGYSSWWLWILSLTMVIFTTITDKAKCDIDVDTWRSRSWSIILGIGTAGLVATSMYISFTPVGLETINGCQPRYIIPLLFGVLIFLGIPKWGNIIRKRIPHYNALCLALLTFIPYFSLWQVYIQYIC